MKSFICSVIVTLLMATGFNAFASKLDNSLKNSVREATPLDRGGSNGI